jgi:hypothetical protein
LLIRRKKGEFMGDCGLGDKVKIKETGEITEIVGMDMESFMYEPVKETESILKIKNILKEENISENKFKDFIILNALIKREKMKLEQIIEKAGYTYINCIVEENNLTDKELDEFFTYHNTNTNNCFVLVKSNDIQAVPLYKIKQGETVIYYGRRTTKVIWKTTDELEKQD